MSAIATTLFSCCASLLLLETITTRYRGASNLITFAQLATVAALGYRNTISKRRLPLWHHAGLSLIYWSFILLANASIDAGMSMPLHSVFRSCTLPASLLVGFTWFGKRYTWRQVASVLLVTIGIVTCTTVKVTGSATPLAILMLTMSLFLQALLGHLQNAAILTIGRENRAELYAYTHSLSLLAFAPLIPDVCHHAIHLPFVCWLALAGYCLLQYACTDAVSQLFTRYDALQVNLIITLRKFVSLTISVAWFNNVFTVSHWIGSVIVLLGVLCFPGSRSAKVQHKFI